MQTAQKVPSLHPTFTPTTYPRRATERSSASRFERSGPAKVQLLTVLVYLRTTPTPDPDGTRASTVCGPCANLGGSGLPWTNHIYKVCTDRTHTHDSGLSCRRAEHAPVDSVTAFPQGLRLTDTHNSQLNSTLQLKHLATSRLTFPSWPWVASSVAPCACRTAFAPSGACLPVERGRRRRGEGAERAGRGAPRLTEAG